MKVFVVIDHFKAGGAERVAANLANTLCKKHEVWAIVSFDEVINYPLDREHMHYYVLKTVGGKATRKLSKLLDYRKLVREVHPDVIITLGSWMATYTAFAVKGQHRGIKVISSERTDPSKEPASKIERWLRDLSYSEADVLVCQTPWVVGYFKKKMDTECVVIPNPITPNLPIWHGSESNTIITACRLTAQKNIPMLLKAYSKLVKEHFESRLVIYGEGELRSKLQSLVKALGIAENVTMPGFTKNLPEIMSQSLMYVSSSDYEGISNSMLEALGVGIPTICTDCPVGGAGMFINSGENGILINVGDEDGLYRAMKRMYEDRNFGFKCSRNSRSINDILRSDIITKEWIDLAEQ